MRKYQQMVQQFHEKAGSTINHRPTPLNNETAYLRAELIQEEFSELLDSLGVRQIDGMIVDWERTLERNPTEIADAIGDLLYVVLGTAVSCGIDIEPIFEEIHRSNMTKFIDGYKREDGKWMKGPSYTPANIEPIIKAQQNL